MYMGALSCASFPHSRQVYPLILRPMCHLEYKLCSGSPPRKAERKERSEAYPTSRRLGQSESGERECYLPQAVDKGEQPEDVNGRLEASIASDQKRRAIHLISYTHGARMSDHNVIFMWSLLPNDLLQLGHLRDLEVRRSSTHSLQKTCPHVLITVSLKLRLQTVQIARACFI
jgi:hypothetical protein